VQSLVAEGLAALLGGAADASAYHNAWIKQHASTSLPHRLAAAECSLLLLQGGVAAAGGQAVKAKEAAAQIILDAAKAG
jgi:hypothetical protein